MYNYISQRVFDIDVLILKLITLLFGRNELRIFYITHFAQSPVTF